MGFGITRVFLRHIAWYDNAINNKKMVTDGGVDQGSLEGGAIGAGRSAGRSAIRTRGSRWGPVRAGGTWRVSATTTRNLLLLGELSDLDGGLDSFEIKTSHTTATGRRSTIRAGGGTVARGRGGGSAVAGRRRWGGTIAGRGGWGVSTSWNKKHVIESCIRRNYQVVLAMFWEIRCLIWSFL